MVTIQSYYDNCLSTVSPVFSVAQSLVLISFKKNAFSYSVLLVIEVLLLTLPLTVKLLQEAESAINAKIQDPIFHRVRDVAPNKVLIIFCHN